MPIVKSSHMTCKYTNTWTGSFVSDEVGPVSWTALTQSVDMLSKEPFDR